MVNFFGVLGCLGVPPPVRPQPYWPHSAPAAHRCTLPHTGVHQYTTRPQLCTSVSGTRGLVPLVVHLFRCTQCKTRNAVGPDLHGLVVSAPTTLILQHIATYWSHIGSQFHNQLSVSQKNNKICIVANYFGCLGTHLLLLHSTVQTWYKSHKCHLLVGLVALIFVLFPV